MSVYFDTDTIVPLLVENHPDEFDCQNLYNYLKNINAEVVISTHSLAETFNSLLKYMSTGGAIELINIGFPDFITHQISLPLYHKAIERCKGISGRGMVYDALYLTVAEAVKCDELYTFNTRHYHRFSTNLDILSP